MSAEEREIHKGVEALAQHMSGDVEQQVRVAIDKILIEGESMKDLLGLNEQVVEGIYGQAYRLYNAGKYKEASQLFRLLVVLNGTEAKYSMGLAACFHMMKEYLTAAELYNVSGLLDPHAPTPYFHASDCYLAVNDKASAIIALDMAVKRAGTREAYSQLKDRAIMTMAKLKEELFAPKV